MPQISTTECLQPTHQFDCPVCSARALDDDGRTVRNLCQHFLFSWQGQRGDFDVCIDAVEAILECLPRLFEGPIERAFLDALPQDALVCQIETRMHAGGHVVRTDVVAFNPFAA